VIRSSGNKPPKDSVSQAASFGSLDKFQFAIEHQIAGA
jgi:hypothetical protein